jgi:hypothetical protein
VEADHVRPQQAAQELLAVRQNAHDGGGREGDVQEEPDARLGQELAQDPRDEQQLVVVHPDEVARPPLARHLLGEDAVHPRVVVPVVHAQRHLVDQVVEQRPEQRVREALVEALDVLRGQVDGTQTQAAQIAVEGRALRGPQVPRRTRPADPHAAAALVRAAQAGREAARAGLDARSLRAAHDGHGESIADDEQAVHGLHHARTRPSRASRSSPSVVAAWIRPTWV